MSHGDLQSKRPRNVVLLNPGPANTTESVKRALIQPDICPRERVFGQLMGRVARQLVQIVRPPFASRPEELGDRDDPDYVAVLFCGSGTAAVEAAIASVIPSDGALFVIDNGAYGARIAAIASAYGIPHDVERFKWGDFPHVARIAERLRQRRYSHLAVVHHETTTGMLNPVAHIGELCRDQGIEMIVDGMSSFAGIPIDIAELGADYLVSSANKCIQGMAGLSFVICRRAALDRIEVPCGRSLYLNLVEQHRFFERTQQMRYTPPVQVFYALATALDELFVEGQYARHRRYQACFEVLDQGMRELGFRRLLDEAVLSRILTAYIEPDHPNYDYEQMHDLLLERGFTIYPGKGAREATFRLANMGALIPSDIERFVAALAETVEHMGIRPLYRDPEDQ